MAEQPWLKMIGWDGAPSALALFQCFQCFQCTKSVPENSHSIWKFTRRVDLLLSRAGDLGCARSRSLALSAAACA